MTHDFLANSVCHSPYMKHPGMLSSLLSSALVQRAASIPLLQGEGQALGRCDRGLPPAEACWVLKASFTLEEVMALEPGGQRQKWCDLVGGGYPAALVVEREEDKDTLAAYLDIRSVKPEDTPPSY